MIDYSAAPAKSIVGRRAIVALIVVVMLGLKLAILAADAVPFNGDEAIVGLMARHILQGERPVFFYGQAYLGSLDAWLVAVAFSIFGDSVESIRLVQVFLYVGTTLTTYLLAWRILNHEWAARVAALIVAIPVPLVTTYTTASLGGYGETLLIGNILLLIAYRLASGRVRWATWAVLGLLAGVGFWTSVMTLVYAVPAAVWLAWKLRGQIWPGAVIAAAGFFIGSAPWWWALYDMNGAPLRAMLGLNGEATTASSTYVQRIGEHGLYFVIFGLPVLFGLRFPWSADLIAPLLAPIAMIVNVAAIGYAIRRRGSDRLPLWGIVICLAAGFLLTRFGDDPSGRYFLPLYLPLSIFCADLLARLYERRRLFGLLSLAALLGYNLVANVWAASTLPPGITTQFDPVTSIEWRHDDELIKFLRAQGITRGYSNYWVTFRIAFKTDESVIFAPRLPYDSDYDRKLRNDRYPAYAQAVDASPRVAYITTHLPELDTLLRAGFERLKISYAETQIADYHVFYDLSRKVTPVELGLPEIGE